MIGVFFAKLIVLSMSEKTCVRLELCAFAGGRLSFVIFVNYSRKKRFFLRLSYQKEKDGLISSVHAGRESAQL